jgi:hypothetical protein
MGHPLLYLDIDGVLLRRRHRGIFDAFEIAPDCVDFLAWATPRFQCRWLSSRCRRGCQTVHAALFAMRVLS